MITYILLSAALKPDVGDITYPQQSAFTDLEGSIDRIVSFILSFGAGLAVLAIIYSGIMYITASGDQTKAETAKKNLIWAITGLVLFLSARAIVWLVIDTVRNL